MPRFGLVLLALSGVGLLAAGWLAITTTVDVPRPNQSVYSIYFFHVPSALTTYALLTGVAVCGALYLINPKEVLDRLALAALEVGLMLGTFVLISGMIWGSSAWGTAWSWEPRLVSMLVMWFIMAGALVLRAAVPERQRQRRLAAVFGIIIFPSIFFVHYATKWFARSIGDVHPSFGTRESVTAYSEHQPLFLLCLGVILLTASALVVLRFSVEKQVRRAAHAKQLVRALTP